MTRRTGGYYGVNESLFSSALAAMVFSTISAQPLTIVGITGLISLFNYTIYDIIKIYDVTLYARFMCWTAIWAAIWHWIVAIWNLCDYMRYVTDFSSETFGMYVGIIYMSECHLLADRILHWQQHSQRSWRTSQLIQFLRKCWWILELYHCDSLLWHSICLGKIRGWSARKIMGTRHNCRLCISCMSF